MGNVERCDTTLPTNEMMFYVRRDPALRARWRTDLAGIAKEFGLSGAEYEAIRDRDPKRLMDLGVHQYYVPQRSEERRVGKECRYREWQQPKKKKQQTSEKQ